MRTMNRRESPYEGNFLWKLTSQANKYTSTQNKLKQATRTIKVFTEDVPSAPLDGEGWGGEWTRASMIESGSTRDYECNSRFI